MLYEIPFDAVNVDDLAERLGMDADAFRVAQYNGGSTYDSGYTVNIGQMSSNTVVGKIYRNNENYSNYVIWFGTTLYPLCIYNNGTYFVVYHYSSEVLYRAWKRFRKYGGVLTAATQNVEECLASDTARLMFANSEFLLLFNQAASDRQALANLLNISDTEMSYVTDAEPGHGLLRMAGSVVPFANDIPRETELYRLMSTTPGEG